MNTRWRDIYASLSTYEPKMLAEAITTLLEARIPDPPRDLGADWKGPLLSEVEALVVAHTGAWYDPFELTFEVLTQYCICHSFLGYKTQRPSRNQIPANVEAMLEAVDCIRGFLFDVSEVLERLYVPASPLEASRVVHTRVERLVDLVFVHTGRHESMSAVHGYVADWLCDVLELENRGQVKATWNARFEHWGCEPEDITATVDDTTDVIMRALHG